MAIANMNMFFRSMVKTLAAMAVLILAACATTQPQTEGDVAVPLAAEVETVDTFEGDGMEIPLDGSSVETFEASLERVKRHTDEAHYKSLRAAIEYLLVYDLEVKRNKEKLAAKLDGETGYQVMDRVGWRKPPPGKSKVVKGAADAKIIDS